MPLRWLLILALLFSSAGWAAEIYTFGKRGDGTRYIKKIDRLQKKTDEASTGSAAKNPPPRPSGSLRQPQNAIPPPIPDAQKLELLDRPI